MALQHCYSHELKTIPNSMSEADNSNGCFDCNICLDSAHEPVVTLCGHLYCWHCIYKWLHVQSDSLGVDEHPQCPVCKDDISHTTMVPLYGRGGHAPPSAKSSRDDSFIPPRPTASGAQALLAKVSQSDQQQRLPYRNPYRGQYLNSSLYQQEDDATSQMLNLGASMTSGSHHHPLVGMFGEMVFAGVFGNSPNSYQQAGSNSSRLRREELQTDKFLNRITNFLFCCFLLCLIVF